MPTPLTGQWPRRPGRVGAAETRAHDLLARLTDEQCRVFAHMLLQELIRARILMCKGRTTAAVEALNTPIRHLAAVEEGDQL